MKTGQKYENAVILAPMVRIGTLPMRLLALDYGADLVYAEEIVDHKILKCKRVENHILGTVDFVDETEDCIVFRTCHREKNQVIFQIGTCDAQRALTAAKLIENDVAGIDVNMGCPKEFSVKGGMGSALLSQPEKVEEILTTLVKNISRPISCKIRILADTEETIQFCKRIERTGVSAVAIHGRTKEERPRHKNHNDVIKAVAESLSIPVIANGGSKEILAYGDLHKFRIETGASAVMVARAAQLNCSIFRKAGKFPMDVVIQQLLKYAVVYDNHPLNTKYALQQMLQDLQESARGKALLASKTLQEICKIWDLQDYYLQSQANFIAKENKLSKVHLHGDHGTDQSPAKKFKKTDGTYEMSVKFIRHHYQDHELPKTLLLMWTRKMNLDQPVYKTEHKDKLFQSVANVNGVQYKPLSWEKNKRTAEQAAALVCIQVMKELQLGSTP